MTTPSSSASTVTIDELFTDAEGSDEPATVDGAAVSALKVTTVAVACAVVAGVPIALLAIYFWGLHLIAFPYYALQIVVDRPTTWVDYGSLPAAPSTGDAVSLRLNPDGTAQVTAFPQGTSMQATYEGRDFQCINLSTSRTYSGKATWRLLKDGTPEVAFKHSRIWLAGDPGIMSVDWSVIQLSSCPSGDPSWQLHSGDYGS